METKRDGRNSVPVRLQPRAGRNEIVGFEDGVLRVRVAAPPEGGKANAALCKLVAKRLGVPRSDVTLVLGEGSRDKVLEIAGLDRTQILERLGLGAGPER